MKNNDILVSQELIETKIYIIRNQKVMLDHDLAKLYEVETRMLTQAVRRNINRFPEDFMFQLNKDEFKNLKSQIVTSSWGGLRKAPLAFSEHGILMLSSVLRSEKAVQVNIQIMRTFTHIRRMILDNEDLRKMIQGIEARHIAKFSNIDKQIKVIFEALNNVINPPVKPKKIGFLRNE